MKSTLALRFSKSLAVSANKTNRAIMKNITSRRSLNLAFVLLACFVCALVLTATASSESTKNIRAQKTEGAIRMFDIGFGGRTFNFQLGRETQSGYLGSAVRQSF